MASVFVEQAVGGKRRLEIAECDEETNESWSRHLGISSQKLVAFITHSRDDQGGARASVEYLPLSLVEDFVEKLNQERGPRCD